MFVLRTCISYEEPRSINAQRMLTNVLLLHIQFGKSLSEMKHKSRLIFLMLLEEVINIIDLLLC